MQEINLDGIQIKLTGKNGSCMVSEPTIAQADKYQKDIENAETDEEKLQTVKDFLVGLGAERELLEDLRVSVLKKITKALLGQEEGKN